MAAKGLAGGNFSEGGGISDVPNGVVGECESLSEPSINVVSVSGRSGEQNSLSTQVCFH